MKKLFSIVIALSMLLCSISALAELEVQEFPASGDMFEMLDLSDPLKTVISGLFHQEIEMGEGLDARECYVYIGAENHQAEANVTLIPDSGVDVVDFLENSGWKEIADEEGLILLIAVPTAEGWNVETDLEYLNTMWTVTHVRNWYNCQKHNSYMLAYGDAAALGQMWGVQAVTPQKLVSFATFGDFEADMDYVTETAAQETKVEGVSVGDVPMPVWFFVSEMNESAEAMLEYWNSCNNVGSEVLSNEWATAIYSAKANTIDSNINEQNYLVQTRYTIAEDAADYANVERNRVTWDFLSSVVRPVGYANNQLHAARSVEEWGASYQSVEVDGVTRTYIEFVPEHLCETEEGKAPAVLFFHGNNQGAETFLNNCEAIKLANDRGFTAILLTGALYNQDTQMPNPRWNLTKSEEEFDDFAYVEAVIDQTIERCPVDASRIYMMGLSYGSMATQIFSLSFSDRVAACAPISGMFANLGGDMLQDYFNIVGESDRIMPMFIVNGEYDLMATDLEDPDANAFMTLWLTANGFSDDVLGEVDGFYKAGTYNITTFENESGVPLIQYGVADGRIHTAVLDDMYIQYDNFLSKYSRDENGTLYYEGNAVTK